MAIVTKNYWYFDVTEHTTGTGGFGAQVKQFTVGPISPGGITLGTKTFPGGFTTQHLSDGTEQGAEITPPDIVDLIQAAFDEALEDGRTDWSYQVMVR